MRFFSALKLLFKGPTPPFPVDIKEFGAVAIESKVRFFSYTQPCRT
jgi:hypothetical protein